jgi:hypothetical protein
VHLDRTAHSNIRHILRRDENELLPIRQVRSVDHHLHTDAAVHGVHEHIEFIYTPNSELILYNKLSNRARDRRTKTAQRTANALPQGEQETDRRERLLTAAKRARILVARALRLLLVVRLHAELQRLILMVEQDVAVVATVRKMELEDMLAPQCNVPPELLPATEANDEGCLESLLKASKSSATRSKK